MRIEWIGGTTFIIKNSTGKRFLLNPEKSVVTPKKYDFKPNIITFNSTYENGFLTNFVSKDCKIINSVCDFENEFVKLHSYRTFKDKLKGAKRGENIIYLLEIDNLKICHLGTIGHFIDEDILKEIKNPDFLFIPIGGHFCLNGLEASKLAYSLNAKYIIPMYYKTSSEYFYLDGPFKFLSSMKNVIPYQDSSIQTNTLSLNEHNVVLFLNHST